MSNIAEGKSFNENGGFEFAQRSKNIFLRKKAFGEVKNVMPHQYTNNAFKSCCSKVSKECFISENTQNIQTRNGSQEIVKGKKICDELELLNCSGHLNTTYAEIWSDMNMINENLLKSVLCVNDGGVSIEDEVQLCKEFDSFIDLPMAQTMPLIGYDLEISKYGDDSLLIPNIDYKYDASYLFL